MKICLDAGHTYGLNGKGEDPGAVNKELNLKESYIAMELVVLLDKLLFHDGHKTIFTRINGSDTLTLKKRCDLANREDCDIFLSLHLNSCDNPSVHGIETLRYDKVGEKTKRLADLVQRNMIFYTNAKDRGVKERNNLYVLKNTDMPAILVEVGFISNEEEALKLSNDNDYRNNLVKGIAEGIKAYSIPF